MPSAERRAPLSNGEHHYLSSKMKTTPASTRRDTHPERSRPLPRRAAGAKLWVVMARAYGRSRATSRRRARQRTDGREFGLLERSTTRECSGWRDPAEVLVTSGGPPTRGPSRGKGLVERRDCPEDRRVRYAALTGEGEALIRRIFPDTRRRRLRSLAGRQRNRPRRQRCQVARNGRRRSLRARSLRARSLRAGTPEAALASFGPTSQYYDLTT